MMKKVARWIDLFIFIGISMIGILNLVFFFVHVSPANLSGLFGGRASISFAFMTISAFLLTALSILLAYLALRRKAALKRLRACLPWRIARLVLTGFAVFFITVVIMMVAASFPGAAPPTGEIAVLGAHVAQEGLSATLQSRLDAALDFAAANPDVTIIVSGGQGLDEPVSEAAAMQSFLLTHGIDESRIVIEENSHNTYENLVYVMEMIQRGDIGGAGAASQANSDPASNEPYPITIVTSEFHIFRTAMLAKRAGFEPYFIPAPTPIGILPSSYSREFFGVVKSYFIDRCCWVSSCASIRIYPWRGRFQIAGGLC